MKQYTKKQITEAIAYWEKRLDEAVEESSSTALRLDEVLESFDVFDICSSILPNGRLLLPNIKLPIDAMQQIKQAASGKVNVVGIYKVLSREEYAVEAELHNDIPYEDYIDNEKYILQSAFDGGSLTKMFKPKDAQLVEDVQIDGKKGQAALVVVYSIS